MTNYGRCKDCRWGEPEPGTEKWRCLYYETYVDADKVKECNHFKDANIIEDCFLTTACCDYKGLPDNYISKQSYGEKLINDYYAEAPEIVEKINASENREEILEEMYAKITDIAKMVDVGNNDQAVIHYMMLLHDTSKLK